MKKLLLLVGLVVCTQQAAQAQYYYTEFLNAGRNPGGLNINSEQPNQAGWTQILFGQNAMLTVPQWTDVQALPIPFRFNGQPMTHFKVATSGVLTFDTLAVTPPAAVNTRLPSAQVPNKSVCIWGLGAKAGDYIVTKTFGTAPNRQHWVQFNSYSEPGNANVAYTYWAIVLEETTNKIYLVDQRTGYNANTPLLTLTLGVQINANTAEQLVASPNVDTTTGDSDDDTPADNSYYAFIPGLRPAYDLALRAINTPAVAIRQSPIPITGRLQNLGSQTISSYQVGYKINNGPAVTGTITGAGINSLANGVFSHPTPWQPTTSGYYSLKMWLALPNGQADIDPSNDTLRTNILVADSTMRRKVVQEDFTSSTCNPYCRLGNINTRAINTQPANRGKFVEIKYQQNFPAPGNDPYYIAAGRARFSYYGGPGIPYMILDGGWNGNSQSYTAAVLNQFHSQPALARIQGSYSLTGGRNVAATATIKPFFDAPAGRLVAHMVITEREVRLNARTNGETRFYDVAKQMLPNQNGTPLPAMTSGQNFTLSRSFDVSTLPTAQAVEHFDSLQVVVFVQDIVTKEVYQGESLTLLRPTATRNIHTGPTFVVAPNPTVGRCAVEMTLTRSEIVRVDVLDGLGRVVLTRPAQMLSAGNQQLDLNLSQQSAGLYTVRLTTDTGVNTRKLTLE